MERQTNNYNLGYSIKRLKEKWKLILFTFCAFSIIGVCYFYYTQQQPVYTSQCILLYQLNDLHQRNTSILKDDSNINLEEKVKELPIQLLPKIAHSLPFLSEIIDLNINNDSIQNFSQEEFTHLSSLKNDFNIFINETDKLITIQATMSSPQEAAKLVQKVQQTLRMFAIRWYTKQKQEYINSLESNYNQIITKSFNIQQELNSIQNNISPQKRHETLKLEIEYKSLEKLSITIAEQLQQLKLDQENLDNYFTILEPTMLSTVPSNTQKSIIYYMIVFAFLGFIISIYIILIHPIITDLLSYPQQ